MFLTVSKTVVNSINLKHTAHFHQNLLIRLKSLRENLLGYRQLFETFFFSLLIFQDLVYSQGFKYQKVHGNFKELIVTSNVSKIHCAAFCLVTTKNHHCTTFVWDQPKEACHCGYLFPFVTGQGNWENMHVKLNCKQSNISGNSNGLKDTSGFFLFRYCFVKAW